MLCMSWFGSDSDPFSRRLREGISFPNFVERSILKLPLSKICAVPFALQNRALFNGEPRAKRCPEKGRKRGGQEEGAKKEKRTRENRSELVGIAHTLTRFQVLVAIHLRPKMTGDLIATSPAALTCTEIASDSRAATQFLAYGCDLRIASPTCPALEVV